MKNFLDIDIAFDQEGSAPQPAQGNEPIDFSAEALDRPRETEAAGPEMTGFVPDGDPESAAERQRAEQIYGNINAKQPIEETPMWGADYTTMSLGDKFTRSLVGGVGQVLNQTGDLVQFIGGMLPGIEMVEDNVISEWLHRSGQDIEQSNLTYKPKEFDEFTWAHLANVHFWATDAAKQIPNLAAFLIPGFGGAHLGRTALSKAVSAGMRKGIITGTKAYKPTRWFAKGTTLPGSGLAGALTGDMATQLSGMVGAGLATNILNSAMIAGDAVNRAKAEGLDDEQAAWVGANTYMDNSKWILMDMVSWGLTFGGINKGMTKAISKGPQAQLLSFGEKIKNAGFKKTGTMFNAGVRGTKVGALAQLEGFEEQFQEVYEEWVTAKNIAEAKGEEFPDYWDFFNSEEMKHTRGVAHAVGMLGGAVPSMINEIAESSRKIKSKEDLLLSIAETPEDQVNQSWLIRDVIKNVIIDEQPGPWMSFINDLVEKKAITEEQKEMYLAEAAELEEVWNTSQKTNLDGKGRLNELGAHAYFNNMVAIKTTEKNLEETTQRLNESLEAKLAVIEDEQTRQDVIKAHQEQVQKETNAAQNMVRDLKKMNGLLAAGKKMTAETVPAGFKVIGNNLVLDTEHARWQKEFTTEDGTTGTKTVLPGQEEVKSILTAEQDGLTEKQFKKFTKEGSEKAQQTPMEAGKSWFDKAKNAFGSFFNKVKSKLPDTAQDMLGGKEQDEITVFEPAEKVEEIPEAFFSEDEVGYGKDEGKWYKIDGDQAVEISPEEALKAYNEIGARQAQKNAKKAKAAAAEKSPQTDEKAEANNAKAEPTTEDGAVEEFTAQADELMAQLENKNEGFISKTLKGVWEKVKKSMNVSPETEAKIEDYINRAKEALKGGSAFISNEAWAERNKKRIMEEQGAGPDADIDIEGRATTYPVVLNLQKYGGWKGLMEQLGDQLPVYYGERSLEAIIKTQVLNDTLKKKFGKGVNVFLLDNIMARSGYEAAAFAVGGSVYITPNSFYQPTEFFHEMLHIHYALNPNDPDVKAFTENVIKNKGFMATIKKNYESQTIFSMVPVMLPITVDGQRQTVTKNGENFVIGLGENQKTITPADSEYDMIAEGFKSTEQTPMGMGVNTKAEMELLMAVQGAKYEMKELPMEQQEILKEEAYVAAMQSTIAEEYTEFFEPREKPMMQFKAKKMWTKFHARVDKKFADSIVGAGTDDVAMKERIKQSFMQMDFTKLQNNNGVRFMKTFTSSQRASTEESLARGKEINRQMRQESKTNMVIADLAWSIDELRQVEREYNQDGELLENDEVMNTGNVGIDNSVVQEGTVNRMVNSFLKKYNQALNKKDPKQGEKGIMKQDIVVPLRLWAKEYNNVSEFILAVRESGYIPIQTFLEYTDGAHSSEDFENRIEGAEAQDLTNAMLADLYKVYSTAEQETPFQTLVRKQGNGKVSSEEVALSKNEDEQLSVIHQLMKKYIMSYDKQLQLTPEVRANRSFYNEIRKAIASYKAKGTQSLEDKLELMEMMFPAKDLSFTNLAGETVFYEGKFMPLHMAFDVFLDKAFKSDPNTGFSTIQHSAAPNFIRAVLAANRKYTLNDIVMNPEGNPTGTFKKQTYLHTVKKRLNDYIRGVHSNPNFKGFTLKRNVATNSVLNFLYQSGGASIESFMGVRNIDEDQAQSYAAMNENAFAISTLLKFFNDSDSYMQTLGTAGESRSHYGMRMPKHDSSGELAVKMAKEINDLTGREVFGFTDGQIDIRKGEYGQDLKKTWEFYKANKEEMDKIAGVNVQAKPKPIRDAIFSNIVNKVVAQKLLFGNTANNEKFTKRFKNANSPQVPFRVTAKLDALNIQIPEVTIVGADGKKRTVNATDGASFITRSAAERLKTEYGESLEVDDAGAFKLMNFGPGINGEINQLKTMTFVLTDELVGNNPILQAIKATLEEREAQNADNPDYFGIAGTPDSFKLSGGLNPVSVSEMMAEAAELQMDESEMAAFIKNKLIEDMQKNHDVDGVFSGMDGSNFGVMQEMDMQGTSAAMPTQLYANILMNLDSGTAMFDQAIAIQRKAQELMNLQVKKLLEEVAIKGDKAKLGDLEAISEYVMGMYEGNDNVNAFQQSLAGLKSLNIPYVNDTAYNTLANLIAKKGNNIRTAGTNAFQSTDLGSTKLNIGEGTIEYDGSLKMGTLENGKTTPTEARIPYHIAQQFGLKAGSLFIASRIPHHGTQTTRVFVVKSVLHPDNGSTIIVPSEFTNIIGADQDGDALYMNVAPTDKMRAQAKSPQQKAELKAYEELFNMLNNFFSSEEIAVDVNTPIDVKNLLSEVYSAEELKAAQEAYKEGLSNITLWGEAKNFNENVAFKRMVGIAAQQHRIGMLLRGYKINFGTPVRLGNRSATTFENNGKKGKESTAFQSAVLMNVVLDNANNQNGSLLGITAENISEYALLINMGFTFKEVKNFMASDGVKAWTEVAKNRNNVFFTERSKSEMIDKAKKIINTNPALTALEKETAMQQVDQMAFLDEMNNEILKVGAVMAGHKSLNGDYNILNDEMIAFDKAIQNKKVFSNLGKITQSPEVARYVSTANELLAIHRNGNIMASPEVQEAYVAMANTKGTGMLKGKKGRDIKKNVRRVLSTMVGGAKNRSQFIGLAEKVEAAKRADMKNETRNPFLDNVAVVNGKIFLSGPYANPEHLTPEDVKYLQWHFARMPKEVREAFYNYDMLHNGFEGNNSFIPFFDKAKQNELAKEFNRLALEHTKKSTMESVKKKIARINSALHPKVKKEDYGKAFKEKEKNVSVRPQADWLLKKGQAQKAAMNNDPHFITVDLSQGNVNRHVVYEYVPISEARYKALVDKATSMIGLKEVLDERMLAELLSQEGTYVKVGGRDLNDTSNLWLIDEAPGAPQTPTGISMNESLGQKKNDDGVRFLKSHPTDSKFNNILPYNEWLTEINLADNEKSQEEYRRYTEAFNKWKAMHNGEWSSVNILKKTDQQLDGLMRKLMERPVEEVAPLLHEISIEKLRRLTEAHIAKNGLPAYDKRHDISAIFKWLGAGNISEKKADLQALQALITTEYTKLEQELDSEFKEINDVTEKLIQSKITGPKWMQWIKTMIGKYFGTRKFYNEIYGNLITYEVHRDEKGRERKDMKLISQTQAAKMFSEGKLSKEEMDFYNLFRAKTKHYGEIMQQGRENQRLRADYIPHLNVHMLEAFTHKGLITAYLASRGGASDPNVNSIVLTGWDPITKSKIKADFGYFVKAYKKTDSMANVINMGRYWLIKQRAEALYEKAQNEDGSAMSLDYITRDTILGGTWMDRFSSERSVKAEELPTMDLNHALTGYVKAVGWKMGTKRNKSKNDFMGWDSIMPYIDGAIQLNQKYGNVNAEDLVRKVTWDKQMMGKNQTSFLGKKGDLVIDWLNTATVITALGFKTTIAVGNIAFGKYSNIRSNGGKQWALGEKRFWGIDGKKNPITGMKKAQAILKRYQLVDKNSMYEIGFSNKRNLGGIIADLSLSFMTLSENWIQGAHFLGMMTEEQWNSFDDNGEIIPGSKSITTDEITKLEYDVRSIHGRGYSLMDQRMIGLYSMGRSVAMFKKWMITNYDERFKEEKTNHFGEKEIGSMRQFGNVIIGFFNGEITPANFKKYYESLPEHQKEAFKRALRGMGMVIMLGAMGMMLGDSDEEKEIKKRIRKINEDAMMFYNGRGVEKAGKVYPYYTARSMSKGVTNVMTDGEGNV